MSIEQYITCNYCAEYVHIGHWSGGGFWLMGGISWDGDTQHRKLNRMRKFLEKHLLCCGKGNALSFDYEEDESLKEMKEWADAEGNFEDREDHSASTTQAPGTGEGSP